MAFLKKLEGLLAPGGKILVVEPASHGPNADALAVRDAVIALGWGIAGPLFLPGRLPGPACRCRLS